MRVLKKKNEFEQCMTSEDSIKYVIEKMKTEGYRITNQRRILLDIILKEECSCCKEIYYKAINLDSSIGMATVYRMINLLEQLGVIQKNSIHTILGEELEGRKIRCTVFFEDGTSFEIPEKLFWGTLKNALKKSGYIKEKNIRDITIKLEC